MKLSVIIVTYNSEKDIYDCLQSLYKYNDLPQDELEVIVVDNQSRNYEAMRARLTTDYPAVRVVQNTHNGGYGQGNNVGIRLATAPIVAIMNPDIRLTMPMFAAALDSLSAPDVLLCAGKQYGANGKALASFRPMATVPLSISLPVFYLARYILDRYFSRVLYLSGAFFFVRKAEFEQAGLFDEQLFMYSEEEDILLRLKHTFPKGKIIYMPQLHYTHLMDDRPYSEKQTRMVFAANGYVVRKNGYSATNYYRRMICYNKSVGYVYFWLRHHLHPSSAPVHKDLAATNTILRNLIQEETKRKTQQDNA